MVYSPHSTQLPDSSVRRDPYLQVFAVAPGSLGRRGQGGQSLPFPLPSVSSSGSSSLETLETLSNRSTPSSSSSSSSSSSPSSSRSPSEAHPPSKRRLNRSVSRAQTALLSALGTACAILLAYKASEAEIVSNNEQEGDKGKKRKPKPMKQVTGAERLRNKKRKGKKPKHLPAAVPWSELVSSLTDLVASINGDTWDLLWGPVFVLQRLVDELHVVAKTDKGYARRLTRDQARCLPVFLKLVQKDQRWATLVQTAAVKAKTTLALMDDDYDGAPSSPSDEHADDDSGSSSSSPFDPIFDPSTRTIDLTSLASLRWIPEIARCALSNVSGPGEPHRAKLDLKHLDEEGSRVVVPLLQAMGAPTVWKLNLSFSTIKEWPWRSTDFSTLHILNIQRSEFTAIPEPVAHRLEVLKAGHCPASPSPASHKRVIDRPPARESLAMSIFDLRRADDCYSYDRERSDSWRHNQARFDAFAQPASARRKGVGPNSLVQLCIASLLHSDISTGPYTAASTPYVSGAQLGLPPHLAAAVDGTYLCEYCNDITYATEVGGNAPGKVMVKRYVAGTEVKAYGWWCATCVKNVH